MDLLISLLIFCIVVGLIYYVLTMLPLPEPFKQIANVVFCVIVLLILLVNFLLPALGGGHRLLLH